MLHVMLNSTFYGIHVLTFNITQVYIAFPPHKTIVGIDCQKPCKSKGVQGGHQDNELPSLSQPLTPISKLRVINLQPTFSALEPYLDPIRPSFVGLPALILSIRPYKGGLLGA